MSKDLTYRTEHDGDLSERISRLLATLSQGLQATTAAHAELDEIVRALRTHSEQGDEGLVDLLLLAMASEVLRQRDGRPPLFGVDQETLLGRLSEWQGVRSRVRTAKPISKEVSSYLDDARRLLRSELWHLASPGEFPRANEEELRALWRKFLTTISEQDPEHERCGYLHATIADLTDEHAPGPDQAVRTYLQARYVSE